MAINVPTGIKKILSDNEDTMLVCGVVYKNDIVVPAKFLGHYYGLNPRAVTAWEDRGLRAHELSLPRLKMYGLASTLRWYKNNTDMTQSARSSKIDPPTDTIDDEEDFSDVELDKVSKQEAERRYEIERVKNMMMKNDELDGKLVPVDDKDMALSSQAVMHVSMIRNITKSLPQMAQHKDAADIQEILTGMFESHVSEVKKISNKKFETDDTLYDIISSVISALGAEIEPSRIIQAINDIR